MSNSSLCFPGIFFPEKSRRMKNGWTELNLHIFISHFYDKLSKDGLAKILTTGVNGELRIIREGENFNLKMQIEWTRSFGTIEVSLSVDRI